MLKHVLVPSLLFAMSVAPAIAQPHSARTIDWKTAAESIQADSQARFAVANSSVNVPAYLAYDCSEFRSWEQAEYYYLMGFAPAALDPDRDRIACELLPRYVAVEGDLRISSMVYGYYGYTLVQARNTAGFYVEVLYLGRPVFATGLFQSAEAAINHAQQIIPRDDLRAADSLNAIVSNPIQR